MFGQVFNFKFLNESTKKRTVYFKDVVILNNPDSNENRDMGVLLYPAFLIKNNEKEKFLSNEYISLKNYAFHTKYDVNFSDKTVCNSIFRQLKKQAK